MPLRREKHNEEDDHMLLRSRRALALAVVTAATLLAACGTDPGGPDDPADGPGEERLVLRVAASTQSGGYPTPYAAIRGPGRLITTYHFDGLGFPDVTGDPKPWLAKSWQPSADAKTWTFTLHDNVRFHDGMPLTSADVVFTFDYNLTGPGRATGNFTNIDYIENVTAPNPTTVVITLKAPRLSFLADVAGAFGFGVVPKHIWSSVTDPARFQGPTALIGSGPYKLASFDLTTNSFNFVANDDFFLGPPKVRQLQIIPVADALLALDRAEVDAASGGNALIPQAQYDALAKRYKVLTAPGEFNLALFFNPNRGFPYDEVAFRQGAVYGLNRTDMVQRLLAGRGIPGPAGALGPGNEYLSRNLPAYSYDRSRSAALLDQVGLRDTSGDGLRDRPDGSPFTIRLSVASSDAQQAQLVKEYLRAVGLNVDIDSVDQQTSDARGASGDYEMAVQHFGGLSGDPSGLISRFTSTSRSTSFTRVHGYRNPAFDQVANEQATTTDLARRRQLVDQMQAILAEDLPQISLYVPDQVTFVNTERFGGFAYTPGCPPCGAHGNKRNLFTGNAERAPAP
ncbi:MAG: ABC transporter substrate-binding protein [Acidimicrobiales bacterium]